VYNSGNLRIPRTFWCRSSSSRESFPIHATVLLVLTLLWGFSPCITWADSTAASTSPDDSVQPARRALFSDELQAFQWGLHIDTDGIATLHGGLQRGTVGNNVIHIALATDTEKLGGPRGGRFALSGIRIASGEASVNDIGDLQVADNLDATSASRVYQLWYRQIFTPAATGPVYSVRAGLIDFNQNFASTDAASLLLNASFGLNPALSANVPISTYPKPGWGLETAAQWPNWQARLGLFQPNPDARNTGFSDGHFLVGEVDYQTNSKQLPITVGIGVWQYHQHDPVLTSTPTRDWGAYASIDAGLGQASGAAHVFLQLGYAPDSTNTVPRYIGVGIQAPSPLVNRPFDRLTAGIAHADINQSAAGSETSYELSYLLNLNHYATLQPDLQFIRHPGGRLDVPDAWVAILRLHLEFY